MSDSTAAFTKFVPGFDFLQGLVKNAGAAMPGVGQWIAPTLDPAVLDKRIDELRTVQFWLEQNARLLATTVQALEVQRMTLTTLKTMNLSMGELAESLKIRMPEAAKVAPAAAARAAPAAATSPPPDAGKRQSPPAPAATKVPAGVIDPMQWWSALTQQFGELAAGALKDGAAVLPAMSAVAGAAAADAASKSKPAKAGQAAAPARKAAAKSPARPARKSARGA